MDPMQTGMHSVPNSVVCLSRRSTTERDRHVLYLTHLCERTQCFKQCARTARRLAIRRICDLGHIRLAVRLIVYAASANRKGFVEERDPLPAHSQTQTSGRSACALTSVLSLACCRTMSRSAQRAVQQTEAHPLRPLWH